MRWGRGSGSVVRAIPLVLWYGFWLAVAVFACSRGNLAPTRPNCAQYLPLVFLAIAFYWQFMPVLTASMGRSLDLKKLAMYPVPHRQALHWWRRCSVLTGTLEMLLVIAGGSGRPHRESRNRRRAWNAHGRLSFSLCSTPCWPPERAADRPPDVAPQDSRGGDPGDHLHVDAAAHLHAARYPPQVARPFRRCVARSRISVERRRAARPGPIRAAADPLLLWTLIALWFGRRQFERNLRFDAAAAQAQILPPECVAAAQVV